jgi:hypothetical protein
MKSGDRVWIPGTIHAEVAGRTQPIYEVDALGDVSADRVLPDSPALPNVARWLAERGNAARLEIWLSYAAGLLDRDPETSAAEIDNINGLIAALETIEAEDYAAMVGKRGAGRFAGATKVEADGYVFDSKREHKRYEVLKLLVAAGEIEELEVHPEPYKLVVNGVQIAKYIADFRYRDGDTGLIVVEDVKSSGTAKARDYRIRKKLMLACHGIEIREVTT